MKRGILALSLGTFSLGISEFSMMGILTVLSSDLGISIATSGHLITSYASGGCLGALLLPFFHKWPLKKLLLVLASVIAIGNLAAAVSPNYITLLCSRLLAGLPHGAFFGLGAIVARKIAKPGQEVMDVALVIAGMSVATLIGVPLATFLSETISWRIPFFIVSAAGFLTFLTIRLWIPDFEPLPGKGTFRSQFAFLKRGAPWLIFGGVLFGQIGLYCWYSYIDPLLTVVSGFGLDDLTWLMVVAGAGMFVGNLVSGKLADRFKPSAVSASFFGYGLIVLLMVYFFAQIGWLMVILLFLGAAALFGSGSPMQAAIVVYSKGGEMLGGTCIQIAYNAGNAIAAWFGGVIINSTHNYSDVSLAGMPIVAIGLVLLVLLYFKYERRPQ